MLIVVFNGFIYYATNASVDELFKLWIGMKQWWTISATE